MPRTTVNAPRSTRSCRAGPYQLPRRVTYQQRVFIAILICWTASRDETISEAQVMEQVEINARENRERLGPRYVSWVHEALIALDADNFIEYISVKDPIQINIQEGLVSFLREAEHFRNVDLQNIEDMATFDKFKATCTFLSKKIVKPGYKRRGKTKRELILETFDLRIQVKNLLAENSHSREDPTKPTQRGKPSSSNLNSTIPESFFDAPEAFSDATSSSDGSNISQPGLLTPATPKTPIRRSGTLDNPAAYPTPQSASRKPLNQTSSTQPGAGPSNQSRLNHHDSLVEETEVASGLMNVGDDPNSSQPLLLLDPHHQQLEAELVRSVTGLRERVADLMDKNMILEQEKKALYEERDKSQQHYQILKVSHDALETQLKKTKAEIDECRGIIAEHRKKFTLLNICTSFWTAASREKRQKLAEVEDQLKRSEQSHKALKENLVQMIKRQQEEWKEALL